MKCEEMRIFYGVMRQEFMTEMQKLSEISKQKAEMIHCLHAKNNELRLELLRLQVSNTASTVNNDDDHDEEGPIEHQNRAHHD